MNQLIDLNANDKPEINPTISGANSNFNNIYNRSRRLATAVFMVANLINEDGELRTKIKKLSLELVSFSTSLKDNDPLNVSNSINELEKKSLELTSLLDIAAVSGFVSEMNANILKSEFQSFISEVDRFSKDFDHSNNVSVKSILSNISNVGSASIAEKNTVVEVNNLSNSTQTILVDPLNKNLIKNGNGQKRKNLRKNTILEFIKGHNNVSIKDIVPNIVGCSEKTVQRELIELIDEGKIKKMGERRWSRYTTT